MIDFNKTVIRRGTSCAKWDGFNEKGIPEQAIPMWVADMDFEIMPQVTEAIVKRAQHGIYGYSLPQESYYLSIVNWMRERHFWDIQPQWITTSPGVVPALNLAVQAFTCQGDGVLIQPPVYGPFSKAILGNNRKLVNNPLVLRDGEYYMDLADFEKKIIENSVKLFILCSPHNPIGRVWKAEELKRVGDICLKHNVKIVADEIHHDLTFPGVRHYPLPTVDSAYNEIAMICTAPSKTFNLAGLQTSNIIIPNLSMRTQFENIAISWGLGKLNSIGLVACEAAYTNGQQWLDNVRAYIFSNAQLVKDFLGSKLPQVKLTKAQGLYLLWLDFRELGLSPDELELFLLNDAKLWLNQGTAYGEQGRGFARINIACSRSLLVTALEQLENAVTSRLK